MPPLSNAKHEAFVQELAKGRTQAEAYAKAGYKPSEQHACRLASSGKVQARLAEMQEKVAVRTEITVATITANLARISQKAEGLIEASGLSVARAAQMDIAKLNGLVIDKSLNATTTLEELLDRLPGAEAGEPSTTAH